MKPAFSKSYISALAIGSLWMVAANPVCAQGQSGSAPKAGDLVSGVTSVAKVPVDPSGRAKPDKTVDDAKNLVKTGRVTDAVKLLTDGNSSARNTKEWHFESSQKLVGLAGAVARDGKGSTTTALVQTALSHLDQAATLATNNRDKAKAKAGTAFIQERFVGDPAAALTNYKAALALDPEDAALKEKVSLLERADANLRAKVRPAKR